MFTEAMLFPEALFIGAIGGLLFVAALLLDLHYRIEYNRFTLKGAEAVDYRTARRLKRQGQLVYDDRKEANRHEGFITVSRGIFLGIWWVFFVGIAATPGVLGMDVAITVVLLVAGALSIVGTVLMISLMLMSGYRWYTNKPAPAEPKVAAMHRASRSAR